MEEANQNIKIEGFDAYQDEGTFCSNDKRSIDDFLWANNDLALRKKAHGLKECHPNVYKSQYNNDYLTGPQPQAKINN